MSVTAEPEFPEPLTPIPADQYEAATREEDSDWADLDSICILVEIRECVRRGLCALYGEDFYSEVLDDEEINDALGRDAERAIDALVLAGYLRREDFIYDDTTHRAIRVR